MMGLVRITPIGRWLLALLLARAWAFRARAAGRDGAAARRRSRGAGAARATAGRGARRAPQRDLTPRDRPQRHAVDHDRRAHARLCRERRLARHHRRAQRGAREPVLQRLYPRGAGDDRGAADHLRIQRGPGAASVYLHLGAMGPRRAQIGPQGAGGHPRFWSTNAETWLGLGDLVFGRSGRHRLEPRDVGRRQSWRSGVLGDRCRHRRDVPASSSPMSPDLRATGRSIWSARAMAASVRRGSPTACRSSPPSGSLAWC